MHVLTFDAGMNETSRTYEQSAQTAFDFAISVYFGNGITRYVAILDPDAGDVLWTTPGFPAGTRKCLESMARGMRQSNMADAPAGFLS